MLRERDKKNILHPFTTYKVDEFNIPIVKGKGAVLWDENGKDYIDAVGSWWVNIHGHAHPYINQKISEQMNRLEHVMFSGFTHEPAIELSEKILELLGSNFSQIFYSDNGSTSVEVAIKMAIQYWSNNGKLRKSFIAFKNSYHGDTFGAMAVSERDVFVKPFIPWLFDVHYIDLPNDENIDRVKHELKEIIQQKDPAGFIFEPLIQGAGGMRMYKEKHLDELIQICIEYNVLTIADEVMTGFYRTGKAFAIDHLENKPDFICLSKGLTGGYLPLGITAYNNKIADVFKFEEPSLTFYHGHSYTANPISCTAAIASIELMSNTEFKNSIIHIQNNHDVFIRRINESFKGLNPRRTGIVLALDVNMNQNDEYFYLNPVRKILYDYYIQHGVLLRPLGNVVYVIPPVCINEDQMNKIYNVIFASLNIVNSQN